MALSPQKKVYIIALPTNRRTFCNVTNDKELTFVHRPDEAGRTFRSFGRKWLIFR